MVTATTPDMRPILVTGATGFLGSALTRRLVQDGRRVRIFRRGASWHDLLSGLGCEEALGDLTDRDAVSRAVAGCGTVFHCAALIQYWDDCNARQTAINVDGTRFVAEACLRHGVTRLVHVSSVAAIGYHVRGEPVDETAKYNLGPLHINYCDTKYAAEKVVQEFVRAGLDAVIINPATIYGPGDARRARYVKGLAGPCTAAGGMAVVDVGDVVEGAIRAWQRGTAGARYILSAENLTYREIGRIFAQHFGWRGPRVVLPVWAIRAVAAVSAPIGKLLRQRWSLTPTMARAAAIPFAFDNAKARRELGMTFTPFAESARRTVEWMRAEGLV